MHQPHCSHRWVYPQHFITSGFVDAGRMEKGALKHADAIEYEEPREQGDTTMSWETRFTITPPSQKPVRNCDEKNGNEAPDICLQVAWSTSYELHRRKLTQARGLPAARCARLPLNRFMCRCRVCLPEPVTLWGEERAGRGVKAYRRNCREYGRADELEWGTTVELTLMNRGGTGGRKWFSENGIPNLAV